MAHHTETVNQRIENIYSLLYSRVVHDQDLLETGVQDAAKTKHGENATMGMIPGRVT